MTTLILDEDYSKKTHFPHPTESIPVLGEGGWVRLKVPDPPGTPQRPTCHLSFPLPRKSELRIA